MASEALCAPRKTPSAESLFDAHCHLQLPRLYEQAADVISTARSVGVVRAAVCGCEKADWQKVETLASEWPDFVAPQFGVHPWWAGLHSGPNADSSIQGWEEELEALLTRLPAAGVGECGLDGARKKDIPMEVQIDVLKPQLELAKKFQRPLSLHCVACHGALLDVLQTAFKEAGGHAPGIVLHSYCGSPEMAKALAKLNCFFSFSGSFLHIKKHASALKAVPLDRLLLETDSPDQLPKELLPEEAELPPVFQGTLKSIRKDGEGLLNEPALLPLIVHGAAAIRDEDPSILATTTAANARRVFDFQAANL
eukprot:TRINITY_DN101044_c0_g1_i1.p1 TRINITY_DN101044_c0_g1~~TRINITY_DN101044_c0_g1_i1.p1  ORF type:complete len:337 (+),score=71.22 TRINITY_DN101044_c0_g1_i1:84-1013(+)